MDKILFVFKLTVSICFPFDIEGKIESLELFALIFFGLFIGLSKDKFFLSTTTLSFLLYSLINNN